MPKPDRPDRPGKEPKVPKPSKAAKLWELLDDEGDAVVDGNGDAVEVVILDKLERGKVLVREIVSGVTHEVKRDRLYREEEEDPEEPDPDDPLAPIA
jgi:hypothetical protein